MDIVDKKCITFKEFVEIGLSQEKANIVECVPWAFKFSGYGVTHKNNDTYLICGDKTGMITFTNKDIIVFLTDENFVVMPIRTYQALLLAERRGVL